MDWTEVYENMFRDIEYYNDFYDHLQEGEKDEQIQEGEDRGCVSHNNNK